MSSSLIVEKPSALLEIDEEEQLPVNANHIQMCKFGSHDDETYEKVYKRVRRILNSRLTPGKLKPATSKSTGIQSPDNTQHNSTVASTVSRSSHVTNGAQLDRAVDLRSGNENLTSAKQRNRASCKPEYQPKNSATTT
ncbi:hypothetical protein NA56DRAFT_707280 [Hyaloscypha hepaticicola]|uniref:Uncharacterized protein n=1 Tax=Hyaloscypha hepaticicola TaxID=2082293 RepID=A0A2J6PVC3_9HELO|nr:hypothetical protein NA56DRAFT_707280 [Hyaloscypha hepaticicola]